MAADKLEEATPTSLHSIIGTGMAAEGVGTAKVVDISCAGLFDEAKVVLEEVGLLLRPGLLLLMIVGEGGCCFFFTASLKQTEQWPSVEGLP